MYFMSTVCGRTQGGGGGPAHVDACGQGGGGSKRDFFVDVINGWPLIKLTIWTRSHMGVMVKGQVGREIQQLALFSLLHKYLVKVNGFNWFKLPNKCTAVH